MLFPKEHGAYGQMAFPLVTAMLASGPSWAGVSVAVGVVAGFLAHEPATVRLGARGNRARRETGPAATRQLWTCAAIGIAAAAGAIATMDGPSRQALLYPVLPAAAVAAATLAGRDKSALNEVAVAVAFSAAAVPVARAGGATTREAMAIAIPFALLFASTTLAVRVVVLGVRGGGDPRAVRATKRVVMLVAACGAMGLGGAIAAGWLPGVAALASAPGLVTAGAIAARPPHPTRLRAVGWTLVVVSTLTAVILIAG